MSFYTLITIDDKLFIKKTVAATICLWIRALAMQGYWLMNQKAQEVAGKAGHLCQSVHILPRQQRVIFLFMHGGVSHVDSFDPKPSLTERNGDRYRLLNRNLNSLRPVISLRLPGNFGLMRECTAATSFQTLEMY